MDIKELQSKLNIYKTGPIEYPAWTGKIQFPTPYENEYLIVDYYESVNGPGTAGAVAKIWSIIFYPKKDFQFLNTYYNLCLFTESKITRERYNEQGCFAIQFYNMCKNPTNEIILDILNYIFQNSDGGANMEQEKNELLTTIKQNKPREKVKHSHFGEGEIVYIKGNIIKVIFGVSIKEFPYPSSINNGTLTYIRNPVIQPTFSVSKIRATTSSQKHRWTFEEDKTCCRIFIEAYISNHTSCSLDFLATKILSIYPNMKFSSIKMKLQNIKRICLDYGIKDSSSISPLDNYSNQNFRAMKEALYEVGIII